MINKFNFFKPESIDEAIELLSKKENTAVLAGGTDLVVNMKSKVVEPDNVIDIKEIKELSKIEMKDDGLFIGAAVTCNEIKNNEKVVKKYPLLVKAVSVLGSHQIRNRATIVGNICSSSPGADTPPSLLIMGTKVLIKGPEGEREVALEDFFTGVKRNVVKDNELVSGILIDPISDDARGDYKRKTRVEGADLCASGVAGFVSKKEKTVKFAYGALAPTPIMIDASDIFFNTEDSFNKCVDQLIDRVEENVKPITDVRSTKTYRENIAKIYTKRIISDLWEEGE